MPHSFFISFISFISVFFIFFSGCASPAPEKRCHGLKIEAQTQLQSLLKAEQEFRRKHTSFTTNFANLNWNPRGKSSLSYRILKASQNELKLQATELYPPNGWPAESWFLDDKGGFLRQTKGCQTGLQREEERESALFFLQKINPALKSPKTSFRFISDGFTVQKSGILIVELQQDSILKSEHIPCTPSEKKSDASSDWFTPMQITSLNKQGAGLWASLFIKAMSSTKSIKSALICEGSFAKTRYLRWRQPKENREIWWIR